MQRIYAPAALVAALLLVGCSNPMDVVIPTTPAEQAQFAQNVMGKLGEKDKAILQAYLIRTALTGAVSDSAGLKPGTTVKQAIAEQTAWFQQQADSKARETQRAQERQAARDAASAQLKSAVKITYAGKEIEPPDSSQQRYLDMQVIYLDVENLSEKPIKGLQAEIRFIDMFGATVSIMPVQITDSIEPGKKLGWVGGKEYNQFNDSEKAIRNLEQGKYSTEIEPLTIVFTDGSKLGSQ